MDDAARQKLGEMINDHGVDVSKDIYRCKGLLKDYCAGYPKEMNVLISALELEIPNALTASQNSSPQNNLLTRLTKQLYDNIGVREELAYWAVESWAIALGVDSQKEVTQRVSQRENDVSKKAEKSSEGSGKKWGFIGLGIGVIGLAIVAAGTWTLFNNLGSPPPFKDGSLTLGIILPSSLTEEKFLPLKEHLKNDLSQKLGIQANIVISSIAIGDNRDAWKDAEDKIKSKEWDIAFTLSPLLSVTAKESKYVFAAKMYPSRTQTESSFFVLANSPIRSIQDITSDKKIALGDTNNAVSFYMPIYDLYTKSVRLDLGNTSDAIKEKVASNEADVGVWINTNLKDDKRFRIISVSRGIPVAGVYLSPNLSEKEQNTIREALLNSPSVIPSNDKQVAFYGKGEEPNYKYFINIKKRVDEISACVDWKQNPVTLSCPLIGIINGFELLDSNTIQLRFQEKDGRNFKILLPQNILAQLPNSPSVESLNSKTIQVIGVVPVELPSKIQELRITAANQIKVVN